MAPNTFRVESISLWWIRLLLAVLLLLYVGLVVLPFYGNGIQFDPHAEIPRFGPGSYPPFTLNPVGGILQLMGIMVAFFGPYVFGILLLLLSLLVGRMWHTLSQRTRILHTSLILIAVAAVLFILSPQGQLLTYWIMD